MPVQQPEVVSPAVRQVQKFPGTLRRRLLSIRTNQGAWHDAASAITSFHRMPARSSPVPFSPTDTAGSTPCSDGSNRTRILKRPAPTAFLRRLLGRRRCATTKPKHYDLISAYYRKLWGPHIHHGFWKDGHKTPAKAQELLIEELIALAGIGVGLRIRDVGCGIAAAASIWHAISALKLRDIHLARAGRNGENRRRKRWRRCLIPRDG